MLNSFHCTSSSKLFAIITHLGSYLYTKTNVRYNQGSIGSLHMRQIGALPPHTHSQAAFLCEA